MATALPRLISERALSNLVLVASAAAITHQDAAIAARLRSGHRHGQPKEKAPRFSPRGLALTNGN
jgi:hypothetical protein